LESFRTPRALLTVQKVSTPGRGWPPYRHGPAILSVGAGTHPSAVIRRMAPVIADQRGMSIPGNHLGGTLSRHQDGRLAGRSAARSTSCTQISIEIMARLGCPYILRSLDVAFRPQLASVPGRDYSRLALYLNSRGKAPGPPSAFVLRFFKTARHLAIMESLTKQSGLRPFIHLLFLAASDYSTPHRLRAL